MNALSGDASVLLHFPCLTPAVAAVAVPGVLFLDPGLADASEPGMLRPAGLALPETELAGFLREFERLRRETKNPKDLALLAGASKGHYFADTTFAVREELEDQLHPERVAARQAKAAQLSLCLAAMIEQSVAELAEAGGLDDRFRLGLAESLGIEADLDDDDDTLALTAALSAAGTMPTAAAFADEFRPPWQQLLSPFWALAPQGAGLFIADPDIAATLFDADLGLDAASGQTLAAWFPDGPPNMALSVATVTGWRLLGKTRPDAQAPWLDTPRPIVVVNPISPVQA
ncbi:hypothetical protein [Desulfovibrio sp. TomC]|uniref:hypothetical protein n=1 Tax=Desulfovibrio sp. TomC TaxID=1562888 RepID=UPI000575D931|nr:hypothetical protein [Desulfovibrio sp. TomC]KHK04258.1 hypothetical protein NY78_0036 [Desulfovibrio sp. TomC]